jgi:hypothetical protein
MAPDKARAEILAVRAAARQAHCKHRALARLARHCHIAAHHARELAGDGKAEAGAAEALRGRSVGLAELLEQAWLAALASCRCSCRQRPRPSATLRARNLTSPSFVNLQALLNILSRICRKPHRIDGDAAEVLLDLDYQTVALLLGELTCGPGGAAFPIGRVVPIADLDCRSVRLCRVCFLAK